MFEKKYNKWINSDNVEEKDKKTLKKYTEMTKKINFNDELVFGTAGIRKEMGIGSSLLNIYTMKMITFAWIKSIEKNNHSALNNGILVARDTRNNGDVFSKVVSKVISGMGYKVFILNNNDPVPTPIVSYIIKKMNLGGGCCITASHNPPKYNGYKIFNHKGMHLMPFETNPIQSELFKIDINTIIPTSKDNIKELPKGIQEEYLNDIIKELNIKKEKRDIKIVFSPQHGASYKLGPEILKKLGFNVFSVPKQSIPNGDFPNTPDPNPENPESFNEMIEWGKKINAELLLTTDPDGDRVALGILHNGKYIMINGHEMASLLTYYYFNRMKRMNRNIKGQSIIKTVVTTTLVDEIAKSFGVNVVNTLTGYKYIGYEIEKLSSPPILTTEESYGASLCPAISFDKDAIQLLPIYAEAANYYKKQNKTLIDVLNLIYEKYGYYIHFNSKEKIKGDDGMGKLLKFINSLSKLKSIGGYGLKINKNFSDGIDGLEKTPLVKLILKDGSWIAIRPSGTEPIIRKYFCIKGKNIDEVKEKKRKIEKDFINIKRENFI